jgi:hypothetical protein
VNSKDERGKEIQRLGDMKVFPSQASTTAFARPMLMKQGAKPDRAYFPNERVKNAGRVKPLTARGSKRKT